MDKWTELRLLINADIGWPVHYSHSREYEHGQMKKVLEWMEYLDKKEADNIKNHVQVMGIKQEQQEEGFLFTSIPTFDQKSWEKILEEKGLQGLA